MQVRRRSIRPVALAAAGLLALACSERTKFTVGPEGGTLASPDGRLVLSVPPGALGSAREIRLAATDDLPAEIREIPVLAGYELAPDGLHFARPVTVALSVPRLPGFAPGRAGAAWLFHGADDRSLEPLETELAVDARSGAATARATLRHFSSVRLAYEAGIVGQVVLPEAAFVNASVDVNARPFVAHFSLDVPDPTDLSGYVRWRLDNRRGLIRPAEATDDFGSLRFPGVRIANVRLLCESDGAESTRGSIHFMAVRKEGQPDFPPTRTQLASPIHCLQATAEAKDPDGENFVRLTLRPSEVELAEIPAPFDLQLRVFRPNARVRLYVSIRDDAVEGPLEVAVQNGDLTQGTPVPYEDLPAEIRWTHVPFGLGADPSMLPIDLTVQGNAADVALRFRCKFNGRDEVHVLAHTLDEQGEPGDDAVYLSPVMSHARCGEVEPLLPLPGDLGVPEEPSEGDGDQDD